MDPNSKKTSTIKLIEVLAPVVSSREIINEILENKINDQDSNEVILDFNEIKFISRSAAHELLKLKEKFANKKSGKKEITFSSNMEPAVSNMIRTVAANRAYSMSENPSFKAEKVDILQLV